ncbi:unnamed protein product, partial [marine sediment metagenome]
VDGKTIYSIPDKGGSTTQGNLALPNVYSESSTQLYDIGTKFVDGERVFHYAYAGGELPTLRGVVGYLCRTDNSQDSYDTSQDAGVGTVANPFKFDGGSADTPAANLWAGQYIVIYAGAALGNITMRIVSHLAAEHDSPYTIAAVLDQPTPIAVAGDTDCDIFPSRYADIRNGQDLAAGYYPFLGVSLIQTTSTYYFWLQTWGPCFITHKNADEIGDNQNWRQVVFNTDGSLEALHETTARTTSQQIAGYTFATTGSGSEWTMLMLDR